MAHFLKKSIKCSLRTRVVHSNEANSPYQINVDKLSYYFELLIFHLQ